MSVFKKRIWLVMVFWLGVIASPLVAADADAEKRVWIDVRSQAEHLVDAIDGDTRVDWDEIVAYVERAYPDKKQAIGLYCRSGGRAGKAKALLEKAGYTNVVNGGGIDDARKTRGIKP